MNRMEDKLSAKHDCDHDIQIHAIFTVVIR